jgi:hypothetical protein
VGQPRRQALITLPEMLWPSRTPGDFTMADLLRFVGDISPIDGITTV